VSAFSVAVARSATLPHRPPHGGFRDGAWPSHSVGCDRGRYASLGPVVASPGARDLRQPIEGRESSATPADDPSWLVAPPAGLVAIVPLMQTPPGGLNAWSSTAGRRVSGTPSAQRRRLVARRSGQRPDDVCPAAPTDDDPRGRSAFSGEPAE